MKVVTKEELCEMLEKNPHWRFFFNNDKEYFYNPKKRKFIWEGWDYWNDWSSCDVKSIDVPNKIVKNNPDAQWHKFTIDESCITFWTKREWDRRDNADFNGPYFKLNVLASVDIEHI